MLLKIILENDFVDAPTDPVRLMSFLMPLLFFYKMVQEKWFEGWLKMFLNIKHRPLNSQLKTNICIFKIHKPKIPQLIVSN